MANVKTAISIDETLFAEVNAAAQMLKISRSQLFAKAVADFLHKLENQRLLEQLNQAYADDHSQQDDLQLAMQQMRPHQRKMAKGTW